MCGRSSLTKTEKELEERFHSTFYSEDLERYNPLPNFNVAPTHVHPVITNKDPGHFQPLRWGLVPYWAKDVKIGYSLINARVETLQEKPAFRDALQKRRCLVPFDGFYEWKKEGKQKIPYRIVTTNTDLFAIAGLWERWKSPTGEWLLSFTLVTQPPNQTLAAIHDRMPAILMPEEERYWLDMDLAEEEVLKLIRPYPDAYTRAYRVSSKVNKVSENDATLIEEVRA